MTLNDIIEHQKIIDKRAIAKDTLKILKEKFYYSESKGLNIPLGEMHIDHFLRALVKHDKIKSDVDLKAQEIIRQQKKTLSKIKRLLNEK